MEWPTLEYAVLITILGKFMLIVAADGSSEIGAHGVDLSRLSDLYKAFVDREQSHKSDFFKHVHNVFWVTI